MFEVSTSDLEMVTWNPIFIEACKDFIAVLNQLLAPSYVVQVLYSQRNSNLTLIVTWRGKFAPIKFLVNFFNVYFLDFLLLK